MLQLMLIYYYIIVYIHLNGKQKIKLYNMLIDFRTKKDFFYSCP